MTKKINYRRIAQLKGRKAAMTELEMIFKRIDTSMEIKTNSIHTKELLITKHI